MAKNLVTPLPNSGKLEVELDATDYENTHGHSPRGRGCWMFKYGMSTYVSAAGASYNEAVAGCMKELATRAEALGVYDAFVHVQLMP